YPTFHTQNCTWNSVLSLVQQAPLLWTVYAPKRLGEYADIKSLWQAWEKDMTVEGVGCTPPLWLIDERWGSRRGHRTDWRPRNNENARKIWANFVFFISCINTYKAAGHTINEAIDYFEGLQGHQSLNQLQKSLQTQKKRAIDEVD
ncbi:hypothetical protein BGW80DRAFT_1173830, partial [Lactifluus volemus]